MLFNAVGALLAIVADVRTLGSVTEQSARVASFVLAASVIFIFGSTIVLGVILEP